MGPGLHLVGEAAKRGLLGRVPSAERLLADVESWLAAEAREAVRSTRRSQDGADSPTLVVGLHPAAEDVRITASDAGRVTVEAVTSAVGPGYHTFMARLFQRIGTDLAIAWAPPDAEVGTGDETGFFETGDRASAERGMLTWLHGALSRVHVDRARGATRVHFSLPARTRFTFEGALATPLGPRDDDWLEAAIRLPQTAIDVWPWFADATDPRYLMNHALCLMWTDVRWRPPAGDEGKLLDEVLGHLRRAQALDPTLPYPWREWAELFELRGSSDPLAEWIASRAADEPDRPPIGYRRRPVVAVHEGWSVTIPGSFAERRTAEELWAGEARRSVSVAATETGQDGTAMTPEAFLDRVAGHLGDDVLHHRHGPVVGKARLSVDASSGVETAVLEGYSAVTGSGAAIRVVIENPGDWDWAIETWHSLEHA